MRLGLEEADAGVKLVRDGKVLIILGEEADEGGVVGADLGYVGKFSGAEFGVAIACWLCVSGKRKKSR